MARLSLSIGVRYDQQDLEAFFEDLAEIYTRYGTPEDVQPHNRARLEQEEKRATQTFIDCMETYVIDEE